MENRMLRSQVFFKLNLNSPALNVDYTMHNALI